MFVIRKFASYPMAVTFPFVAKRERRGCSCAAAYNPRSESMFLCERGSGRNMVLRHFNLEV